MKMHHIVVFVRRSEDFFAGMIYNTYTYIHTYFAGTPSPPKKLFNNFIDDGIRNNLSSLFCG